jgi:MFS family permease
MRACKIQSQGLIVLLCLVNLLNYIDRGIIPGAPQSFRHFITSSLGVAVTDQSVYFGLLSSAFIIGHSVLSIVFGYFALTHRPFRIIALGTSIWIVAIVICAVSEHVNSYALLIVGRVLSGAGEASFQCVAPPFIDRHAPPARRSFYVGIYLASVIVGTAIGFVYGSLFAESALTWAGAFYFEAVLMACLVFCCFFCVPDELNVVPPKDDAVALRKPLVSTNEFASEVMSLSRKSHDTVERNAAELSPGEKLAAEMLSPEEFADSFGSKAFFQTWWEILSDVPFLLVVLAHGAYTFTLGVFNAFGPDVFIGLGLFSDETSASLIFGGIVAATSLVGTPLGGFVLDRYTKHTTVPGKRCFAAVSSLFVYVTVAEVFALIMCFISDSKGAFLACFTIALFCMCALWGPEMVAVLELFPSSRRSMAISANAVLIHVFGDVPAPIVMGVVHDKWAPNCGTVEEDGDAVLNPLCSEDQDGLKNFMLLAVLWMVWAVILWALAMLAVKRRQRKGGFVLTAPAEL